MAAGPLPPPHPVPGGPAVCGGDPGLGAPPACGVGRGKLRPPATASGPAPPDPVPENARAQGAPVRDPSLSEAVGSEDRLQAGQEEMRGLQRKKRRSPRSQGLPPEGRLI